MKARTRGFTLIELLVAISILAIVAVLGWRGLDGIVRARIALGENMETTRGMQLAFAQMQSDCEHVVAEKTVMGRAVLQADDGRLTLVRNVYNDNEPSRLQVVSYRLVEGVLLRRETAGTRDLMQLDVLWRAATSDTDTSAPVMLQKGVLGMTVQTWDNGGWRAIAPPATAPADPKNPPPGQDPNAKSPPVGGLQVALRVEGMGAPMSKAFLMGGM
jgi:general secretion pathway protein J